ncbi:MAG: carbon monoxide dehydrogenase [Chloroflexi bacterium]|nr:carbon monoxide dehydrogenase [Chloroflexota bacterium]
MADRTIHPATSEITRANRLDHLQARWGYKRGAHRVQPGLYALGHPTPQSPVFVTANYSLSFDALRSALAGQDGYLLVLDTKGINVWCAAGKGTFGTDELVHRIAVTGLEKVVAHRRLILPQLGATGVAAHEVKWRSGFRVEYGPVRAADLPEYLRTSQASPQMRRVRFNLWDRLTLVPVELVHLAWPTLVAALLLYLLLGAKASAAAVVAVLAGAALFPLLLPWLPTRDFSAKGWILGGLAALAFAAPELGREASGWLRAGHALAYLLAMPPVTAYLALNFTGSTTFTSPTAVRREIFTYIRPMAIAFGAGALLIMALAIARWIGG